MKPVYLLAASALALTAAACGPKTPPARAALDCPMTQGDLTRTSAAPDGKACTYAARDGAEVTLQLVSLNGGVDGTLSNIETVLLANRAEPEAKAEAAKDGEKTDAAATAEDAKATKEAISDADKAAREAEADAEASVRVEIGKDGKTEVVTEDGGETRVSLPGIHIVANDRDDTANVRVGPLTVNAGEGGATVRIRRDVRLRGEALNPEKRGVRATFIYTGKDLPEGYRYVGYEAGGPKAGPITVAVVKSKSDHHDVDEVASDVRKLVRKNGGV